MGRGAARLSPEELREFVKRQNRITGISAIPVDIPGDQGESFKFTCSECGVDNEAQTLSEKGIDSTLITHLFDTMEHWRTATIVSQDVDYCPAVRALRKRGKLVYGAGFIKRAGEALITECFGYKDLMSEYIQGDMSLFLLFQRGGRLSQLVKSASEVDGATISAISPSSMLGHGGMSWSLSVRRNDKITIRPDLEDPLLEQAEVIKREFPFIRVRTKHSREILIEMFMRLTSRQQQSLYRVSERYLDFEVKCPDDVY
jgi:hypothetical protein